MIHRYLVTAKDQLNEDQKEQLHMACAGAKALSSLSESRHNKEIMRKYGLVPLMARLLKSIHLDVVIPIMGTCQHCASQVFAYFSFILFLFLFRTFSGKLSTGHNDGGYDSGHCRSSVIRRCRTENAMFSGDIQMC